MTTRTELGAAVRAWRERVSPQEAGLPGGGDRRVPGLRREELALLVGISVDYLVRLEQGRATHPSAQVLAALSRALRLGGSDRETLYRLAGAVPPPSGSVPREVPRGVRRMLDRMSDTPVAVFTAAWDIVQWNALWAELVGDPAAMDGRDRNLVWRHFAEPAGHPSRVRRDPDEEDAFEREMVSDLRRAMDRYPDDRAVSELIAALIETNPRFAERWARFEGVPTAPARKTIVHPVHGPVELDCDVLTIGGGDLRIVLYSAEPDSPEAVVLENLRSGVPDVTMSSHRG
ncbi:helix-turn-helix domain-containing protein [Leifsonia sp. AG29]|uniref:helix-turn-helix domain-containing protein n=1 Tax=Leifsonia sp. AG29 TaxID=2598860 RepID=UPI00131E1FF5|nr:helix-turn-helix transcriptional regulator [Leifsonia sp. AG29]